MCYAQPGARCFNSYSEAKNEIQQKLGEALMKRDELETENEGLMESLRNSSFEGNREEAVDRMMELNNELNAKTDEVSSLYKQEAELEEKRDATREGMKRLEQYIGYYTEEKTGSKDPFAFLDLNERDTRELAKLTKRLDKAQKTFRSQMDEYDRTYNKVDGKIPSPYYLSHDRQQLQKSMNKAHMNLYNEKEKLREMEEAESREVGNSSETWDQRIKVANAAKKVTAVENKLLHATTTAKKVQSGDIHVPLSPDVWNRELEFARQNSRRAYNGEDPVAKRSATARVIYCQKQAELAEKGYQKTFPTLTSEDGKPADVSLRYDEHENKWKWSNGRWSVPVKDNETDEGAVVDLPGGKKFTVKHAAVPSTVRMVHNKMGHETPVVVPDFNRCINPAKEPKKSGMDHKRWYNEPKSDEENRKDIEEMKAKLAG